MRPTIVLFLCLPLSQDQVEAHGELVFLGSQPGSSVGEAHAMQLVAAGLPCVDAGVKCPPAATDKWHEGVCIPTFFRAAHAQMLMACNSTCPAALGLRGRRTGFGQQQTTLVIPGVLEVPLRTAPAQARVTTVRFGLPALKVCMLCCML